MKRPQKTGIKGVFSCVFIRGTVDVQLWACELLTFCRGTKTHMEVKDYGINTLRACCEESEQNVTILQHVMKPLPLNSSQYVLITYCKLHTDLLLQNLLYETLRNDYMFM